MGDVAVDIEGEILKRESRSFNNGHKSPEEIVGRKTIVYRALDAIFLHKGKDEAEVDRHIAQLHREQPQLIFFIRRKMFPPEQLIAKFQRKEGEPEKENNPSRLLVRRLSE